MRAPRGDAETLTLKPGRIVSAAKAEIAGQDFTQSVRDVGFFLAYDIAE